MNKKLLSLCLLSLMVSKIAVARDAQLPVHLLNDSGYSASICNMAGECDSSMITTASWDNTHFCVYYFNNPLHEYNIFKINDINEYTFVHLLADTPKMEYSNVQFVSLGLGQCPIWG